MIAAAHATFSRKSGNSVLVVSVLAISLVLRYANIISAAPLKWKSNFSHLVPQCRGGLVKCHLQTVAYSPPAPTHWGAISRSRISYFAKQKIRKFVGIHLRSSEMTFPRKEPKDADQK